jgi:hypothetical protein
VCIWEVGLYYPRALHYLGGGIILYRVIYKGD